MSTISCAIIILLFVMLLTIFVGRASELIITKIQKKTMRPAMETNIDRETIKGIRQVTP